MKVSVFAMPTIPATLKERKALRPIGRNTERYQMMLEEVREIAVLADELGYDAFSTTEHHLHSEGGEVMPDPITLYADLAVRTQNIHFYPMSIVPTAGDPIRIAESIALLDQLTKGRVGATFARGYQKRWIQILSQGGSTSLVDADSDVRNREVYNEHIDVILKAWTQDSWDHDGKHYQVPFPYGEGIKGFGGVDWTRDFGSEDEVDGDGVIRKIGVTPPPYQRPYPPIWVPYTVSPASMIAAAKRGFTCIATESRPESFRAHAQAYQAAAQEQGRDLKLGELFGATRSVCIGETREEAFEMAVRTAAYEWHNYFNKFGFTEMWRTAEDDPNTPLSFPDEAALAKRLIETRQLLCGTVDDVRRQMEELHTCHAGPGEEEGQLDWMVWQFFQQGTVPLDVQKRQLELFAEKVLPAVR
ncbi:LLM class flavin-dependent oxidoreductase [Sporichthya polymorpha]|uniref:LLM class flavin-dependent oxidoreductase n=1 Tax=Sporichthya polymorpha TaxID=35751 RepID=UPI0003680C92|nr:LLM class flavin-dependent oxidoreductase [Sporichthya polymorpha]